ncbi:DUF916 domain-containing protein [Candidatus Mycosynbacter amalyticus]|uniref:DUF916 domain-containing protein n=1 Tax=Candidatus Mycosynbacter amalyticus TaxID=2665156 RepID=UPI0021B3A1FC|nr:DUF916 domain-containing protein [Candidatus Mycosynbacter amalyticus]
MGNKGVLKQQIQTNVRTIISVVAMVVLAAFVAASVQVQHAHAATANTLKVSPVRSDIELKPGESKTIKMVVTNLTGAQIDVKPLANDFVSGDERGTPALILDADKYAGSHSLKRFMAPLANFSIPAKKTQVVEVTFNAPRDAKPGGYFGAVRFAPTTPDSGGQVNLSASVASIVLATVPGNVTQNLTLTNFDLQQDGANKTYFTTPDNIQASFRFHNDGDVHLSPFGKVSVKNGSKVVYEADFNQKVPREMVLPDSNRRWDVPLKNIGTFGKYEVHATFTYGTKNQTIEQTRSFWVIPQLYIILALVALVIVLILIGLLIWFIVRKSKNRKPGTSTGRGR